MSRTYITNELKTNRRKNRGKNVAFRLAGRLRVLTFHEREQSEAFAAKFDGRLI